MARVDDLADRATHHWLSNLSRLRIRFCGIHSTTHVWVKRKVKNAQEHLALCYVEQEGKDGHSPAPHTCPRSECRYRNRRLPAPNEVAPALARRGQPCNRRRAGA